MPAASAISLQRAVQVAEGLPTAPKILADLQEMLKDANNGLEAVTGLLRRDAALTGRVIRIANGVLYGRGDPVASLEEALGRVGFEEVYRLAGMASLTQFANFKLLFYGVSAHRVRENALFTAMMTEELAPAAGLDVRTAYTIGLFRSVGKIVLDATAQRDMRNHRPPPPGEMALLDWEREFFGLTSNEVVAAVLKAWRFPAEVFVPIRDHHLHGLAVEPFPTAKYLNLAAAAADAGRLGLPGEKTYWDAAAEVVRAEFNLTAADLAEMQERTMFRFERARLALA